MQHHAKSTSPSCKRKIHFLLSPYILSDAVFKELTSENHPHSHQLETAFSFTSLKPPRQQLFLPAASVCSADRGKRWSLHLNKTTVAGFRLNRCQPHRTTQPAAYRPAAGRANTPGHGERETRVQADAPGDARMERQGCAGRQTPACRPTPREPAQPAKAPADMLGHTGAEPVRSTRANARRSQAHTRETRVPAGDVAGHKKRADKSKKAETDTQTELIKTLGSANSRRY